MYKLEEMASQKEESHEKSLKKPMLNPNQQIKDSMHFLDKSGKSPTLFSSHFWQAIDEMKLDFRKSCSLPSLAGVFDENSLIMTTATNRNSQYLNVTPTNNQSSLEQIESQCTHCITEGCHEDATISSDDFECHIENFSRIHNKMALKGYRYPSLRVRSAHELSHARADSLLKDLLKKNSGKICNRLDVSFLKRNRRLRATFNKKGNKCASEIDRNLPAIIICPDDDDTNICSFNKYQNTIVFEEQMQYASNEKLQMNNDKCIQWILKHFA